MKSAIAALLCALSAAGTVAAEPLSVGVATTDITPPVGYPMSGYFSDRGATGTLDPLLAKAIVFQQGDLEVGLLVVDMLKVDQVLTDIVRQQVSQATGIQEHHLIISATHSHTGPDYQGDLAEFWKGPGSVDSERLEKSEGYVPHLIRRMSEALVTAHQSVKPMQIRSGAGHEERVSFNRRFIMKDGTVRTWAELSNPDVVKAAGPIDPEIGLLSFSRPGEEGPTAAIVNFALHCDTVGGTKFSADFPGHIARVLGKQFDPGFTSVFATGPCGDINHNDPTGAPRRSAAEIGEIIARSALEAWPSLEKCEADLGFASRQFDLPAQDYTEKELAEARHIYELREQGENFRTVRLAWASKIQKLHTLRDGKTSTGGGSVGVLLSEEGPPGSVRTEVQAVRLCEETALVALPGEIFVKLGLAIKKNSPFQKTFVIELANSSPAYVPTRIAYERGGYEAINSLYAPGGGERLVEVSLELLKTLDSSEE